MPFPLYPRAASRIIPSIVALFSYAWVDRAWAGNNATSTAEAPTTQPVAAASEPIVWKSDGANQNALIWRTELDGIGSIAVAGRMVVVGAHRSTCSGCKGNGLLAGVSKDCGKILWSVVHAPLPERLHDIMATISSTPFIDGDRVYYISNRGELCCVALNDGHALWTVDMPAELGVFKCDSALGEQRPSPIVVGGMVYCVTTNGRAFTWGQNTVAAPDAPSFLAVDKLNGKVRWSSNAPGKEISYGQWSTPALARAYGGGEILFPGGDGALYAFEPLSGKQLWKIDCRDPTGNGHRLSDFITAPPVVVGSTAYVSSALDFDMCGVGRRLLAIDLKTHSIHWAASPKGFSGSLGPMAFSKGTLYAASTLGTVIAVDAASGKTLWTRELGDPDPAITIVGGIAVYNDRLYLITQDGELSILPPSTGETLDQCDVGDIGMGTPVVENDRVYVITRFHVIALRLPR